MATADNTEHTSTRVLGRDEATPDDPFPTVYGYDVESRREAVQGWRRFLHQVHDVNAEHLPEATVARRPRDQAAHRATEQTSNKRQRGDPLFHTSRVSNNSNR